MSIHSSLKVSSASSGARNVWTRVERLAALKKQGRWSDGDEVEGLPKVRTGFKAKKKVKEAAPAAAAGAVPAAGAKAGAPAKAAAAKPAAAAAAKPAKPAAKPASKK